MRQSALLSLVLLLLCATFAVAADKEGGIMKKEWGKTPCGKQVYLYTLTNANGMTLDTTNFGAIIVNLTAPDKDGKFEKIVVGYDDLAGYIKGGSYFGCFIGRYGNRIAGGKFPCGGKEAQLVLNETARGNTLHGGKKGFDQKVIEDVKTIESGFGPSIVFSFTSEDGDQGFPGNLKVKLCYTLSNDNELIIHYSAETDKETVCNLTNHSYFNLSAGDVSQKSLNAPLLLKIYADRYTPVDKNLIPTGELAPVAGTPFDFREFKAIGKDHDVDFDQLNLAGGYDHNWVLNKPTFGQKTLAATLKDPKSGRVLDVYTTEPGIQFYAGVANDGKQIVQGKPVAWRSTVCLETQHYPDSPNHPEFPTTTLKPGEKYDTQTIYKFSVEK